MFFPSEREWISSLCTYLPSDCVTKHPAAELPRALGVLWGKLWSASQGALGCLVPCFLRQVLRSASPVNRPKCVTWHRHGVSSSVVLVEFPL